MVVVVVIVIVVVVSGDDTVRWGGMFIFGQVSGVGSGRGSASWLSVARINQKLKIGIYSLINL